MADERITSVRLRPWDGAEPYFKFTLVKYAKGFFGKHDPWRVEPRERSQSVHKMAGGNGALIDVFQDALVVGSAMGGANRTLAFLGASVFALVGVLGPLSVLPIALRQDQIGVMVLILLMSSLFVLLFIWTLKLAFFMPKDFPSIFNRKTREVTFLPQSMPKYWKFWSTELKRPYQTEKWDDLRARSYSFVGTNVGRSFNESCKLMMLWGGLNNDPKALREAVEIGFTGHYQDELLWMLWEHIRRYMEEDGPAIRRGEKLRELGPGKPIVYPPEVIAAAGGPPLSREEVARMAAEAPGPEA